MKLLLALFIVFSLVAVAVPVRAAEKVIVDSDMVEMFDDGVAMLLLANAPEVELLGVTTVAGNTWPSEGTAFALRQLELSGLDVPVAEGVARPLRPGRVENFATERKMFGIGADQWVGALDRADPGDWEAFYRTTYNAAPTLAPDRRHAVDFIIEMVRANPNEVTIAAIGPATNLALAILKAPDIVPLVKRVVYMGGSFSQPGNVTPAAEFNWWFDPEAARIAVRAPFREQVVVGLDVCEKVPFRRDRYDAILKVWGDGGLSDMLRANYLGKSFESDPAFSHYIWDVITAAIIIDPSLVTATRTHAIDITTDFGLSYGHSLAYPAVGPEGSRPATIVTEIDTERFWKLLLNSEYWPKRVK
ncbi:MAG: nucleoside hydrolase [Planctomycetes bacterium]|nr:nucleoside hydrolase [Planctomycetota bacterium]